MPDAKEPTAQESAPEVDPIQLQYALEQLRSQQNLPAGLAAGLVAAGAGAGVWALITVVTGYQIGFMAVGVGLLVGFAVGSFGKGIDNVFGIVGATLALLGCGVGNLFAMCGFIANEEAVPFLHVVSQLDFAVSQEILIATFTPIDLLFYGLAVYEGYRFSFRRVGAEEMGAILPGN